MNKKNKLILLFSLLASGLISLFASAFPDGLEYVAGNLGFIDKAMNYFPGLFSEYALPGISNEILAGSLAGIFGTLLIFMVLLVLGKSLIYVLNQTSKNQKN
jgi:cobalt/nickel transport protein